MEAKFHRKVKSKIQKKSDFEGFQLSEYYFLKILFAKMVKIFHEINKSLARSKKKRKYKSSDFYTWFSVCSQKYRRIIKDLYLISGL
jgi:hypothetical protein